MSAAELTTLSTGEAYVTEIERYVLRAATLPEYIDDVRGLITDPVMFSRRTHGAVYAALVSLHNAGRAVDAASVWAELARLGLSTETNLTLDTVEHLFDDRYLTTEVLNFATHAEWVRDQWARRATEDAAQRLRIAVRNPETELSEATTRFQAEIEAIGDGATARAPSVIEIGNDALEIIESRRERAALSKTISGIPSGITAFDAFTGGFQAPLCHVIGARTSIGKSSFTKTITHNTITLPEPVPTLYMTAEERREIVLIQIAAMDADVSIRDALKGRLDSTDYAKLRASIRKVQGLPLRIVNVHKMDDREIRAEARRAKREMGVQQVIVDYLQKLGRAHARESRLERVSRISNMIYEASQDFNQVWHVPAQLNRMAEGRAAHFPLMSDLKECGDIEQDADMVTLIHRPEYYGEKFFDSADLSTSCEGKAKLIIAKCRNDDTHSSGIEVAFYKHTARFTDVDPDPNPQQYLGESARGW